MKKIFITLMFLITGFSFCFAEQLDIIEGHELYPAAPGFTVVAIDLGPGFLDTNVSSDANSNIIIKGFKWSYTCEAVDYAKQFTDDDIFSFYNIWTYKNGGKIIFQGHDAKGRPLAVYLIKKGAKETWAIIYPFPDKMQYVLCVLDDALQVKSI